MKTLKPRYVLSVHLNAEEYELLKKLAGDTPLSTFIKQAALEAAKKGESK